MLAEAEHVLDALAKATSREGQLHVLQVAMRERSVIAALDVAVADIFMEPNVLRIVKKLIMNACTLCTGPKHVDTCLTRVVKAFDDLQDGCFISAAQASELMAAVQAVGPPSEHK